MTGGAAAGVARGPGAACSRAWPRLAFRAQRLGLPSSGGHETPLSAGWRGRAAVTGREGRRLGRQVVPRQPADNGVSWPPPEGRPRRGQPSGLRSWARRPPLPRQRPSPWEGCAGPRPCGFSAPVVTRASLSP